VRRLSGVTLAFALLLAGGLVFWLLHDSAQDGGATGAVLRNSESSVVLPDTGALAGRDEVQALLPADVPEDLSRAAPTDAPRVPESYRRALGALTGRVLHADGQPVPGLPLELLGGRRSLIIRSITAFMEEGGLGFDPVVGRAVTDGEGRFRLEDLQPRTIGALVLDPAGPRALLWPLEVTPVTGETRDLGDIVLPATCTLRGIVVDEHNRPVAGARVRATDLPGVDFVPDVAQFRAGGGMCISEDEDEFAWVPPAEMSALISRLPVPTTATSAEGRFELTGVPPGLVTLAIDEPAHLAFMQAGIASGAAGGARDLGTLVIGEGVPVTGRVVDGAGEAVANAEVLLGNPLGVVPGAVLRGPFRTEADGTFKAVGFRPGAVWGIARRDGRDEWTISTALATGAENTLRLSLMRTLTLRIVDKLDAVVPDAAIYGRAVPDDDIVDLMISPHPLRDVTRDDQGNYIVKGLKPAEWEIVVKAPGRPQTREEVNLTEADGHEVVRLGEGRALPVLVLDPAGQPVEWATVEVMEGDDFEDSPLAVARTGEDGRAQLVDLPAAELWVSATHPAWAVAQEQVDFKLPADTPPGEAPPLPQLVITLEAGGKLVGKVIDGGSPPPEPLLAILVPNDDSASDSMLPRLTVTDLEGGFSFDHLEAAEMHVEVRSRENFTGGLQLFEAFFDSPLAEEEVTVVAQGETSVLLDIGARYAGMDTATVVGSLTVNGRPGDGWKVRSWGDIRRTVTADARGQFDLGRLEAGTSEITFSAPSSRLMEGFADRREIELQPGERRVLDVALSTGSVSGRVLSATTGRPLAGARVQIVAEGDEGWGRMLSTASQEDGHFELDPVAAGRYRVMVRAEDHGNFSSEEFDLAEMETKTDLLLRVPAPLRVSGRVRFEGAEQQPEWLYLVATAADGRTRDNSRVQGDDHEFAFEHLSPGEWTFSIATDLDAEFEEVKMTIDTDLQDLMLTFACKPEEVPSEVEETLKALGYVGTDEDK
jgi:5-hydroxyisourate hydrolase-like protein (transthyretin family)